jgi:hypothetical protein
MDIVDNHKIIGKSFDEAKNIITLVNLMGDLTIKSLRIVRKDDDYLLVHEDLRPTRLNVSVKNSIIDELLYFG